MTMAEYIDREALWIAFEHEPFYDNADRDEIVLPKIDDFPAANVTPVVHGQWEQCIEDWRKQIEGDKCSCCGFEHYGCAISHYHYCPNCGAKMDGDKEAT